MERERFSKRQGFVNKQSEITIRESAPKGLRYFILDSATQLGFGPNVLRRIICKELRIPPDIDNWSEYPNIWNEVQSHFYNCDWFKVYDVIELVYGNIKDLTHAQRFEEAINNYFLEEGVGWQLENGLIVTRGTDSFETTMRVSTAELKESGRTTAASRIIESISDLSRRPTADLPGAISHAIAALECVASDITGNSKATLGDFLKEYPEIFSGLRKAIEGIWGYACNEGARHGKEGKEPERDEAELIVGLAASVVTYLNRKNPKRINNRQAT